jgi:CheY-like chemotaxis protein
MNLISNAAEAIADQPGVITVRTGVIEADDEYLIHTYPGTEVSPGRYIYLEVSDTGCGMDEETKAKIFDPFFTTKFSGRGLGLAALLGIVRAHWGTLRVDSERGRGTTFQVLFSRAHEAVEEERAAPELREPWRGTGTVLLVDDEEEVRGVTRWMLESAGFSVVTAADGREGVDLFRRWRDEVTAVVLDLTMPEMGGEEAFEEIRRIRADARILLVSGYGEKEVTRRLTGETFTGFIQKPYEQEDLVDKLRQVIQG